MKPKIDIDLLYKYLAEDETLLGKVIENCTPYIKYHAGYLGYRREMDDLLQEIWIRLWQSRTKFDGKKNKYPIGWFKNIVTWVLLDSYRKMNVAKPNNPR